MSGRLEYCFKCGDPTGRAGRGDDSIYDDADDSGPYCENCWRAREEAMTTKADELLALARKATAGEWIFDNEDGYGGNNIWAQCSPTGHGAAGPLVATSVGDSAEAVANAAYIAAANPSAIIALIEGHNAEVERLTQIIVGKEVAMGLKEAALAAAQNRVGVLEELAREVAYDDGTRETVSEHNAFPFFSKLNQRMCMLRDKARAALAAPGDRVTNDQRGQLIRSDERDA